MTLGLGPLSAAIREAARVSTALDVPVERIEKARGGGVGGRTRDDGGRGRRARAGGGRCHHRISRVPKEEASSLLDVRARPL